MKGMNKIKRGKNFRGVISYALAPAPHHMTTPVVIGGNLVGITVDELIAEFANTQKLREDVTKPVWHNSLRLPVGESLTNQQWKNIADDYMKRMGFCDTHLRCYVLHNDEAGCSGQQKLATALEFFQNNRSDSFGVKPPLY